MLLSSFSFALCLLFSLSFANRLATIYASRLLQLHIFYLALPLSLNSLDREGVRLLSPRDSQILPNQFAGAYVTSAGDATELRWELNEDLGHCYVSFHVDQ